MKTIIAILTCFVLLSSCQDLLWCTQYAINGHFPSLDPLLVNTNEEQIGKGITAKEVLQVQEQYQTWWLLYGDKDNPDEVQPLDGTPFRWF